MKWSLCIIRMSVFLLQMPLRNSYTDKNFRKSSMLMYICVYIYVYLHAYVNKCLDILMSGIVSVDVLFAIIMILFRIFPLF